MNKEEKKLYINDMTARFDNSENLNALVTYSSTINDLSFGNITSDSPFSVSLFYRRVTAFADDTNEYLIAKSNGTTSSTEYQLIYDSDNDQLSFYLYDGNQTKFISYYNENILLQYFKYYMPLRLKKFIKNLVK